MSADKKYHTFTEANFAANVLSSDEPVLVDFWANWCPPCRALSPTIDALAEKFDGNAKVGKVDVDANPELARQFAVNSIPTLIYFQDGSEVERVTGLVPESQLSEKLSKLIEGRSAAPG